MRLSRAEKWLFVVPVLMMALPLIHRAYVEDWWWKMGLKPDKLDAVALKLSGPDAIDCGRVRTFMQNRNQDYSLRQKAGECAVEAFKVRKAFRVRFDDRDLGSVTYRGIAMTPKGQLYFHYYNSIGTWESGVTNDRCKNPIITGDIGKAQNLDCNDS